MKLQDQVLFFDKNGKPGQVFLTAEMRRRLRKDRKKRQKSRNSKYRDGNIKLRDTNIRIFLEKEEEKHGRKKDR